jgi:error-prone DNA polymerase
MTYAEPIAATNFSFLTGASHPGEMVEQAIALGMDGIGIADRNSAAGVVRAHSAWKTARKEGRAGDFKLIVGARLVFADGTPDIVAYPMTRRGWGRLTRLLSTGNLRAKKGECLLRFEDLLEWADEMALIALPLRASASPHEQKSIHAEARRRGEEDCLRQLRERVPDLWLGATMHRSGSDKRQLAEFKKLSAQTSIPLITTNDALYATAADRPYHDILTCIREKVTIHEAGTRLAANGERYLKDAAEMARLFVDAPEAIAATADLFNAINFTLDELAYEYPHEPVPMGWTPQGWLTELTTSALNERFPEGAPPRWTQLLDEELRLIGRLNYAAYFLTVYDIVKYARAQEPPILCQGRGSAANSLVCYLLGVTSVDPVTNNLLFSRFLSEERAEPPDIDVDFEHERREEVMQYVYKRYGRHRAGIVATVIHYRPKSTLREVGKALGFTEDVTARLSGTIWGSWGSEVEEARIREAGFDPDNPEIRRMRKVVARILNFPRHLSQHVGGFVLTEDRLDETVPILNAAMEDRTFIEWDKDDIDALGLLKVDVLALGMLTCIRKSFEMIARLEIEEIGSTNPDHENFVIPAKAGIHNLSFDPCAALIGQEMDPRLRGGDEVFELEKSAKRQGGKGLDLASIPAEDPAVYDMLCTGDSIGVFQVESRAQINMLPRLRPREFYDLVVQVAIVRPGPIEGEMVHPYLRRRSGIEPVTFPSPNPPHAPDELRDVLGRTFGVPLFQEQAMKLAIVAAEFTPDEANGLRRAMATFRNLGTIDQFREKMVGRMVSRGYTQDFAERCFKQIEGFGSYGFPESHAQAFGYLVYVSAWIKCHHPAVFAAALLNSQPMGFYAPAQIVRDAREHGVPVLPIDVNASEWDNGVLSSPLPFRGGDGGGGCPQAQCPMDRPHPNPVEGLKVKLRLGLRQIDGFREDWADAITAARRDGPFTDIESLAVRARLNDQALKLLADADALRSLNLDRRQGLWEVHRRPGPALPLFAFAEAKELAAEPDARLPAMALSEHVAADYQTQRLSLKGHPMQFLRKGFTQEGIISCAAVNAAKNGAQVKAAGVVLIRQRPGKGNAVFITIEDEGGIVNILLWARLMERQRRAVMAARLMEVHGEVQRSKEGVVHLMAHTVIDRSAELARLSDTHHANPELARADEVNRPQAPRSHPRNVRILPKSRDFH